MSRENFMKNLTKNKTAIITMLVVFFTTLLIVGIATNAASVNDQYVVEIKNDGTSDIAQNEESALTKKVVEDDAKSLTIETAIENLQTRGANPEVAIVIDTSKSMQINDTNAEVKTKANTLVTELKNNVTGVKISVSSNTAVKTGMSTSATTTYVAAINALTFTESSDLNSGIAFATGTFSATTTNDKILIIFSDATDSIQTKIDEAVNNGIKVYSILVGITNNEYQNNADKCNSKMISDIDDFSYIYDEIDKSILGVKVTDTFSNEINAYFTYELISNDSDVTIEKTATGYILNCDKIKAGQKKTFKYKLTLKENTAIDAGRIYRDINVSNSTRVDYKNMKGENKGYDANITPTIFICNKYSLTVQAVSEKSAKLAISGLDVKVEGTIITGKDGYGNDVKKTVYQKTLTTDSYGKIKIDELKTLGEISFEIMPQVDETKQFGYTNTSATTIIVHNEPTVVGAIWADADRGVPIVDAVNRNIDVTLDIRTKGYTMELEMFDADNTNGKLAGVEFRLIQPKLNNSVDMEAITGITDENGLIEFSPTVMTRDGSYQYILSQMTDVPGYDSLGNATIVVSFINGKVTGIKSLYNTKITTQGPSLDGTYTKILAGVPSLATDTFNFELNLRDVETLNPIEAAIYNIELTRNSASEEVITTNFKQNITDANGQIKLELPGDGFIGIKITEKSPRAGYGEDPNVKEVQFEREKGKDITRILIDKDNIASFTRGNNKIVIDLTSKKANEQNRIKIKLVDNNAPSDGISNVLVELTKVGTNDTVISSTDSNGIATFALPKDIGDCDYNIAVTAAPYGFQLPNGGTEKNLGVVRLKYNTQNYIYDVINVSNTVPTMNVNYTQDSEKGYKYDTANVTLGLMPDITSAYTSNYLRIKVLSDPRDPDTEIMGAKYTIKIISDNAEKELTGVTTNGDGEITTRIVGGQNVTISITETGTIDGYVMNLNTQTIELEEDITTGKYIIKSQTPNTYDPASGQYIGAEIGTNEVIYHDVNKEKTIADTYLNLYVNEMDKELNLFAGVMVDISSETLKKINGDKLNEPQADANGVVRNSFYTSDNNGYFQQEQIKVDATNLNNGERVDYITLNEIDNDGNVKPNTKIVIKFTFRYNANKDVVEVTNIEATWGNKLLKTSRFSGRQTNIGYESDVYLDIFTNYNDVGNFSLDLKKVDDKGTVLNGSTYDVIVSRMDGTKLIRKNINVTSNVEFEGFSVDEGTTIEITENTAPIGYELNEYTEIIKITAIDPITKQISYVLEPSSYSTPRASATDQDVVLASGDTKKEVTLELVDYELNSFKFGISVKDAVSSSTVQGYSFVISSTKGAQANTDQTDTDGKSSTLIGANYKTNGEVVKYTIDTLRVAPYYKELATPIEVYVVFDENGEVNYNATKDMNANINVNNPGSPTVPATGYGIVWNIESASIDITGNNIDISIIVNPQEKLTVNVIALDRTDTTSTAPITGVEYQIKPCKNIAGTGASPIEVGYVIPENAVTYTLTQTNDIGTFEKITPQQFKITYDSNGDIDIVNADNKPIAITDNIKIDSYHDKEITVIVKMNPKLKVNVTAIDRNTKAVLTGVEYSISPSSPAATGASPLEVAYVKPGEKNVEYTLTQTNNILTNKTIEPQKFAVTYDADGNIDVINAANKPIAITDNITIDSFTRREISVTVQLNPQFTVNLTTEDSVNGNKLTNIEYEITPSDISSTGTTSINVGYVEPGKEVKYTINQTKENARYMTIENLEFKVEFDDNGNIISTESLNSRLTMEPYSVTTMAVKILIEPQVPFVITNTGYFDGLALFNAEFKITSASEVSKTVSTDSNGKGIEYVDELKKDTTVRYTIEQTKAAVNYQTVETFEIEVTFDSNRYITDAKILGDVNKYVKFIDVNVTNPSIFTDEGYNGNDRGIINLSVKNYPEVQFNITNVDKQNTATQLAGATYKVTSSNTTTSQVVTDASSAAVATLGRGGFITTLTYTIAEVAPASRYQSQIIDGVVEVDFDEQGFIKQTRITKRSDILTISLPGTQNATDKLKLNIQIASNPKVSLKINKIEDGTTTTISGVSFSITARINKNNLSNYTEDEIKALTLNTAELTEEQYLSEVIDRLKIREEKIQTIKEDIVIDNIIASLKTAGNLTQDQENDVNLQINNNLKISKLVELGKTTYGAVNTQISGVTNKNIVDRLVSNGTTTQNDVNDLLTLVKNLVRLDSTSVVTDQYGTAIAYMDKALANKTIEYTIKETRKVDGYDWPDEIIILNVEYDSQGKIVATNGATKVSGNYDIANIDVANFEVDLDIKNTPSKEFSVHITVEDMYDSDKKLETAKYNAYIADSAATDYQGRATYTPRADGKYAAILETGSTMHGTSSSIGTTIHGEDAETFGVYEEGAGTAVLRLVQQDGGVPNTYYLNGTSYQSTYQSIAYQMLINVKFDDEGKVTGTNLRNPGNQDTVLGYLADDRYVQVSNTGNTINVTIKYFPMLQIQMQAVDMYTGDSLKASYSLDTRVWGTGDYGYVASGYIGSSFMDKGRAYSKGYATDATVNNIDESVRIALSPTEAENNSENRDSRERTIYLYETGVPSTTVQYQQYREAYMGNSSGYLIGRLKIRYTEKGEIESAVVQEEIVRTNIKGFIAVAQATVNNHTIQITIKYAPITRITATVVDEVQNQGLSSIEVHPYLGGTYTTNKSYSYSSQDYYMTGAGGTTGWAYWGASIQNSQNIYRISTSSNGSTYDGYFNPGIVKLNVDYGADGRISSVTVGSVDQFNDPNAIDVSWTNNDIKISIKYSRKFNVKLNKVDYDNSNIVLSAGFTISTSKSTSTIPANTESTLGKVYPGKIVEYTLSENVVPDGYLPLTNMKILVEFKTDGSILSATSTSDCYETIQTAAAEAVNSQKKIELIANIKNKPRFDFKITLSDEYYPTLKLAGGTFTIENDKGDISSGSIATDANGIIQTYIGTPYADDYVTYTVKQTNTIPGYYANNTVVEIVVEFNGNGVIKTYSVRKGTDVAQVKPTDFVGKRKVEVSITNMPKDVKIGITKTDGLTKEPLSGVEFNVTTAIAGGATTTKTLTTKDDGTAIDVVDNFVKQVNGKTVRYTISEIKAVETYRKIQDVVIDVNYREDGTIVDWQQISKPSNVKISVGANKAVYKTAGEPVHICLEISNDNAYDLLVKDEDINYNGLGVTGTIYDVTVNGVQSQITTNSNGIATLANQTQSGTIEIGITERTIGEGYREDSNNTTTIEIEKGVAEYSLALNSNSNPTYADVVVDQTLGTITVTFKNETKLEMTLVKQDINTKQSLEGAVFEIEQNEIDSAGDVVPNTQVILTSTGHDTTDSDGKLYFDLGLSIQNKTIKYTFTEITPPEGYDPILPMSMTVQYDAYGNIANMTDDAYRLTERLATTTGKSHHLVPIIGNGTITPAYTVKVVSKDSLTGSKVNGAIFQVEATNDAGEVVKQTTGTTADVTENVLGTPIVTDKGILNVNGIGAEGDVQIKVTQVEAGDEYVFGNNKITGTIKINAEFIVVGNNLDKDLKLTLINDDGYDVTINNENRTITVAVENDPKLGFELTAIDSTTQESIPGAEFKITSQTVANSTLTSTGLNRTFNVTDADGKTVIDDIDNTYARKTVIYTITQTPIAGFEAFNDVIVSVQYDTDGNIISANLSSSANEAKVITTGTQNVNRKELANDVEQIVNPDVQAVDVDTGNGTKRLQIEVLDTPIAVNTGYQIQLNSRRPVDEQLNIIPGKDDSTVKFLPGVTYAIEVNQEYGGVQTTKWTATTDADGKIVSQYFDGYGYIVVKITEVSAPDGYKLDTSTQTVKFYRNEVTNKLTSDYWDIPCEFSTDNKLVTITPLNELYAGNMNIVVSKADRKSGTLITAPAGIKLEMVEEYETVEETLDTTTGQMVQTTVKSSIRVPIIEESTDGNGRILTDAIKMPTKTGTYTYYLTETYAPTEYNSIEENEVEIQVTYTTDAEQNIVIDSAIVKDASDVKVSTSNKILSIIVYDQKITDADNEAMEEDEFSFKLTNVDSNGVRITTGASEFTITDKLTNEVRNVMTDDLGEASLEVFKIPETAGKYRYTITQVSAPQGYIKTDDEVEAILTFDEDADGKIYLSEVTINGKAVYKQPQTGNLPSKKIQIGVIREDAPYVIKIEKHHQLDPYYPNFIPGVEFDITVEEEYGETYTWNATTNDDGIIESKEFNGYGNITVTLVEKSAPQEYQIIYEPQVFKVYRDKDDKELHLITADNRLGYDYTTDPLKPIIRPSNDTVKGKYNVVISKMDKTNTLIANNSAKFELYMLEEYTTKEEVTDPITGDVTIQDVVSQVKVPVVSDYTDDTGRIAKAGIDMPTQQGTYKFVLSELEAPTGYDKINDTELEVEFGQNENKEFVIKNVTVLNNYNVKLLKVQGTLISIAVEDEQKVADDEYSLDITKVDETTNEPIEDSALFKVKLPDDLNTSVYAETRTTDAGVGKLDYCYIEQNKDYSVRLTHMKKPTADEIIASGVDTPIGQVTPTPTTPMTNTVATNAIATNEITTGNSTVTDTNTEVDSGTTGGETTVPTIRLLTQEYVFKEIVAPTGYSVIEDEMTLTLQFAVNEATGGVYIYSATSDNDALRINTITPCDTSEPLSIDILNGNAVQNKFTVHYDANDNGEGTVVPADQIKQKDVDLTLDTLIPERTGYTFGGWAILPTSTVADFQPGDTFNLNQDITLYAIWEGELYLRSEQYLIGDAPDGYTTGTQTEYKDGDLYISRILPYVSKYHEDRTTVEMFKNNITTNADTIEIIDTDGNVKVDTDKVGTGMTLKLTRGNKEISVAIIVTGDTNGDGVLTAADISAVTNHRLGKITLVDAYLEAADTNYDKDITAADKSRLTNIRLNLISDF